jgi:hypothetical protein
LLSAAQHHYSLNQQTAKTVLYLYRMTPPATIPIHHHCIVGVLVDAQSTLVSREEHDAAEVAKSYGTAQRDDPNDGHSVR